MTCFGICGYEDFNFFILEPSSFLSVVSPIDVRPSNDLGSHPCARSLSEPSYRSVSPCRTEFNRTAYTYCPWLNFRTDLLVVSFVRICRTEQPHLVARSRTSLRTAPCCDWPHSFVHNRTSLRAAPCCDWQPHIDVISRTSCAGTKFGIELHVRYGTGNNKYT
jgi:hypothetical protein